MKNVTIHRFNYTSDRTQGLLYLDNDFQCNTLELPWLQNIRFKSCVSEGEYTAKFKENDRFSLGVFEVFHVPDRDGILIHTGNDVDELLGCILVGVAHGAKVYDSRVTFANLLSVVGQELFNLSIRRL